MNRVKEHRVLPSGLHALHIVMKSGTIRVKILTEEEYTHFTWWERVKLNFNLITI
jgi:hypothetical protein|tara:strand:+ start:36 stop:200 length:165 start_codon:yes stop_codon:yes gene_type:complete